MLESFFSWISSCACVQVPQPTEEAIRYYQSGNLLWIFEQFWALFIPGLFLFTGVSMRFFSFAQKWGKRWFFVIALYLIFFLSFLEICNLPLNFYADYLREHAYGLSTQSLSSWMDNIGKSFLITLTSAIAFVWIFYLLLKKSPKRWWFYSSFVLMAIFWFFLFIQPTLLDPLFNNYGPMKDKQLEVQIMALAKRANITDERIYEVEKMHETKTLSAYMTGWGKAKRIVLWDTLLSRMNAEQILFVVGHEMGHYVLHHLLWLTLFYFGFSFFFFYCMYKTAPFLLSRFRKRFGFQNLSDIASLPLFIVLAHFFFFLFTPLSNSFSRYLEHEADCFGLEITQNNRAAAEAFIMLQKENLSNPRPGFLYTLWRSDHPSLAQRIDFCNHYCPWKKGQPLIYARYFSPPELSTSEEEEE